MDRTIRELRHDRHTMSQEIKLRSSKLLREEFPHLKEWCGDTYVHNFPLEEEYERERYRPWHNQKGLRPFMTYRGRATSPCFDKPFLKVFKRRRSVRRFDGAEIAQDAMEQILEAGRWAPSGANAQPWRFVVVTRKETLAAIAERCYYKAFRSRHVGEAGAVVVICSDPEAGSQHILWCCNCGDKHDPDGNLAGHRLVLDRRIRRANTEKHAAHS